MKSSKKEKEFLDEMKEKFDKRLEEAFDDKTGLIDPATVKGTLRDIEESDFPDEVKSVYLDHVIKMYDKRINKFLGERKEKKKTPRKSKGPSKLDLIKQITASISDNVPSDIDRDKLQSIKDTLDKMKSFDDLSRIHEHEDVIESIACLRVDSDSAIAVFDKELRDEIGQFSSNAVECDGWGYMFVDNKDFFEKVTTYYTEKINQSFKAMVYDIKEDGRLDVNNPTVFGESFSNPLMSTDNTNVVLEIMEKTFRNYMYNYVGFEAGIKEVEEMALSLLGVQNASIILNRYIFTKGVYNTDKPVAAVLKIPESISTERNLNDINIMYLLWAAFIQKDKHIIDMLSELFQETPVFSIKNITEDANRYCILRNSLDKSKIKDFVIEYLKIDEEFEMDDRTTTVSDMAWSMMIYQKVLSRKLIDVNMDVFTGKLPADNISDEKSEGVVN